MANSILLTVVLLMTIFNVIYASIQLPTVWSNGAVIQRNQPVELTGWSDAYVVDVQLIDPNKVTIFNAQSFVDPITSAFNFVLPAQETDARPFTIVLNESSSRKLLAGKSVSIDFYFGDVILCSGQSNMELPVHYCYNSSAELAATFNFPNIRVTGVPHNESDIPLNQTMGPMIWQQASPASVQSFSAVCWYTARDLSVLQNGSVVLGLIDAVVGGTRIESWTRESQHIKQLCGPVTPRTGPNEPYVLYNAMIHPLVVSKIKFKSVLWYQGEENAGNATNYACRFPLMIEQWRSDFNDDSLPFHFVMLGPLINSTDNFPALRMSQFSGLSQPYTAVVPAYDLGDVTSPLGSVHFRDKQPVGQRLAFSLWNKVYGHGQQNFQGPQIASIVWPDVEPVGGSATILLLYAPDKIFNQGLRLAPTENCTLCCSESGSAFKARLSTNRLVSTVANVVPQAGIISLTYRVPSGAHVIGLELDQLNFPECVVKNAFDIPSLPLITSRF